MENAQQEICETAEAEVLAQGYAYPVRVSLVREEFPFKKYDDLIFPAGVYDALRIEIGAAEGQNWWCVLYPQMCFVDAAWGYSTEESHDKMQDRSNGKNHDKVQMTIFMVFCYHSDQAAGTAAQNRQKEKILFGNPPAILYGSFFINHHCKIQNQIDNQVIPDDNQ